ncbi:cation:proton antiporter [Desulfopila inferna]|uniref:cation:proton antiporter n=1 Tax=Desulfopila inferna TaxID=468528 RepID=UPI001965EF51|nr:monovalent cation/H(+) antiporter subunit G [Desulfopila inferna]MBM9604859.1 monovalent cation/H(+) antiporter subunit G [Desulfopila inferna]
MTIWDIFSLLSCLAGGFFFLAGTVGMLRFPDAMSRLHALTKADNLGLGFIVLGLSLRSLVLPVIIKLLLIWFTVMLASSTACYLVGNSILEEERKNGRER